MVDSVAFYFLSYTS